MFKQYFLQSKNAKIRIFFLQRKKISRKTTKRYKPVTYHQMLKTPCKQLEINTK